MRMQNLKKIVIALTTLAVLGFGYNVMADDGQGYRGMGKGKYAAEDQGKGYGRGPGDCGRLAANLSEEDLEKARAERNAFFESTRVLRQNMYQKDLELRAELAKQAPDVNKAAGLQKEISEMRTEMDQKRLEHRLRMKTISPELGMGYGHQGFKGKGGSRGGKGHGGGHCWD